MSSPGIGGTRGGNKGMKPFNKKNWIISNCARCDLRFDKNGFHCDIEEAMYTYDRLPAKINKRLGEVADVCPEKRSIRNAS